MPRMDGTGPMGAGTMTGRGLGLCTNNEVRKSNFGMGFGRGRNCRRGLGRDFTTNQITSKTQKELLNAQKATLQSQLEAIDKKLDNLY